jgi:3-oxoacyl-[acyl-carrier protein] reductase
LIAAALNQGSTEDAMNIAGNTAIITGAASGIGRELALVLAERGAARLLLWDVDDDGLAETCRRVEAAGAHALLRRTDVADLADLAAAFAQAAERGYDIVFNNAGVVVGKPEYPEASLERIDLLVRINLTAVLVGTKFAIEHLSARGGGVIVNTGSQGATWGRLPDAPYRATKAAVYHLTECCRELAASANVRVCAFHPGATQTPILQKLTGGEPPPAWVAERMAQIRLLDPREVAVAAIALVEDDTRVENLLLPNAEAAPA